MIKRSVILAIVLTFASTCNAQTQSPSPTTTTSPLVSPTPTELLAIMNERDQRYNQRFESQEKAVQKAESAAEKRFDSVNEFRNTLKDQQNILMPRSEANARLQSIEDRVKTLEFSRNQESGRSEGANWLWGVLVAAAGVAGLAVGIFLAFRRSQ